MPESITKIKVKCPRCEKEYTIGEDRIPKKGGKITCRQCGFRILVTKSGTKERQEKETVPDTPAYAVQCPACGHSFQFSPPAPAGGTDPKQKTILLVEDEAFFSSFVIDLLKKKYRVLLTSTIDDACAVLADDTIDLILLDLVLKSGDGKELLKRIEKTCPIIVFSSRDKLELHQKVWNELRKLGADNVIYKGMNLEEELPYKIEELLS